MLSLAFTFSVQLEAWIDLGTNRGAYWLGQRCKCWANIEGTGEPRYWPNDSPTSKDSMPTLCHHWNSFDSSQRERSNAALILGQCCCNADGVPALIQHWVDACGFNVMSPLLYTFWRESVAGRAHKLFSLTWTHTHLAVLWLSPWPHCDWNWRFLLLFKKISDLATINPFSVGTVFRRQNLTSADVRFWRIKMIPALKES